VTNQAPQSLTTISKLQSIIASRHEVVNDVHCSNHKEECKNFNCAIVCNIVLDNNFLRFWFDIDLYLHFFPPSLPLPLQFIFQSLIYIYKHLVGHFTHFVTLF
jgi:hypothetical protein